MTYIMIAMNRTRGRLRQGKEGEAFSEKVSVYNRHDH